MNTEASDMRGQGNVTREVFSRKRRGHWDDVARSDSFGRAGGKYYHQRLKHVYRLLIHEDLRVLEVGCGRGDLLDAVRPSAGVGLDFSPEMIRRAREAYPGLTFMELDAHAHFDEEQKFDVIIISDLVDDLWDVQTVFERVREHCHPGSRIILNFYSRLWEMPLKLVQKLGLATPTLPQNWLTLDDVADLLYLADFEVISSWQEILWPVRTPVIDGIFNRFLVKMFPASLFALTNIVVARPRPVAPQLAERKPSVSIVVPARNEAGNIGPIFERTPVLGGGTELIFVEGHSSDNTYEEIERQIAAHPHRPSKVFRQKGIGKADAVRLGFENATGDILMILDADMTVAPEDLPRFYDAMVSGQAEFANGVRLVYPMEDKAMRFLNLLGNKFFTWAFSRLLRQPIKDTLCGTKVLWRKDYDLIVSNRAYFGDFDPFGDYDLIFGAAKLNLKMTDIPIRYRNRTYGSTQIQRWKHGWLLLKMVAFAARRIKFV